jgi:glyoxylase-like metal-dependent hydrolase (beta-lactamase superfamily II)/rhodanese-related sulfurtransferase
MKVEQIYTGCLSQGAYYIESNGEAAVIDPLREVSAYLHRAEKNGAVIKYVFETHFHADFVSGHLDLAAKTGAAIVYGPDANPDFPVHIAHDGEAFCIGALTLKALHTPGHTLESTCYLLYDEYGKEYALFTGDTLFIGDVGRPDLAQQSSGLTREGLAGLLFDSLERQIKPLPDSLLLYPAHGAGSACGKNMSKETFDTLGHQKEVNYALKATNRDSFIKEVTDNLLPPPAYFPQNVALNKNGYASIDDVLQAGVIPLDAPAFESLATHHDALVLDVRASDDFAKGHIPRSVNINLSGQLAPWAGALIPDLKQAILLVTPEGKETETVTRLARVGFDHCVGFLKGGIDAWQAAGREIDTVNRLEASDFVKSLRDLHEPVLDVRKESEFAGGHVDNALIRPLDFINDWMPELDTQTHFYIYCASGNRSMTAASILKARGIHNFSEVDGGFKAIQESEQMLAK